MIVRLIAAVVATAGLLVAQATWAQAPLFAPEDVVIHIHKDVKNTDFVKGLVCELGRVLVAQVRATTIDLPLSREYLASPSQLSPDKLADPFANATGSDHGRVFRYLILPYDLKEETWNYLFAKTFLNGDFMAMISTIRLQPRDPGLPRKQVSDTAMERVYKLMLKSVAVLAGLRTNGCVMAFPRNLSELDQKVAEFCHDDRAVLVAAGILKDKPFGACSTFAMAGR